MTLPKIARAVFIRCNGMKSVQGLWEIRGIHVRLDCSLRSEEK